MDALILELHHKAKGYAEQGRLCKDGCYAYLAIGIQQAIEALVEQNGTLFDLLPETLKVLEESALKDPNP